MTVSNRAKTGEPAMRALKMSVDAVLANTATRINIARVARELDDLGYIIIPKPYTKPARRGNEVKDIGEIWIGKSHSSVLAGG
jgi:hypothetical protein